MELKSKHISILVLTALILLSSLRVSITYMHYYLAPDSFTELFCENKDKPELECHGKCHLNKVIQNSSDEDEEASKTIVLLEKIVFVSKQICEYNFVIFNENIVAIFNYTNLYNYQTTSFLKRPPQV